jgi:biopolymer transport protein TolR
MPALVSRGRGRRSINEINMVPFIDVMLVLLIIFMVTAPLIAPSMIELPSVGRAAKAPDLVIQIIIGKDEALSIKSQEQTTPVVLKDLVRAVRAAQAGAAKNAAPAAPAVPVAANAAATTAETTKGEKPAAAASVNTAVVISADKSVKYESVVKVMDVLQRAGIQRVGLSVQMVNAPA